MKQVIYWKGEAERRAAGGRPAPKRLVQALRDAGATGFADVIAQVLRKLSGERSAPVVEVEAVVAAVSGVTALPTPFWLSLASAHLQPSLSALRPDSAALLDEARMKPARSWRTRVCGQACGRRGATSVTNA